MNNNIINNNNLPSDIKLSDLETVQLNRRQTKEEKKVFSDSTKKAFKLLGGYKEIPTTQTNLSNSSIIPDSYLTNVALGALRRG